MSQFQFRYVVGRAAWRKELPTPQWELSAAPLLVTDSLIEASFTAYLADLGDDGTSWAATRFGPYRVFDRSLSGWQFVYDSWVGGFQTGMGT